MSFLPINKDEMKKRGWNDVDFVIVSGDAYVDHPSFGTAIIGRWLERLGFRVAVLAQPDWRSADDFKRCGRPRLGFLINSGNVDSMVNNYSVFRHRRKEDRYSPGGKPGRRPDRAVIVYSNRAREAYKDVPVIIGGLEASLRRLGHYDYWDDRIRRSILLDSKADILIYGMGEKAVLEIADALDAGISARDIGWVRGTCVRAKEAPQGDCIILPDFEEIIKDKKKYCESFAIQSANTDSITGKRLAEKYDEYTFVVQNPPQPPLESEDLDDIYELPYEGNPHPVYEKEGGVPAIKEVRFSITASRGCFGECSFCALAFHQGRQVRSRSRGSIVREAEKLTKYPDFKGYIHDIGGPTANFRNPSCRRQVTEGVCRDRHCMWPHPCPGLEADHSEYLEILREVSQLPGVKKVFIRSGIRFDYVLADKNTNFIEELCRHHVSGTLKVAPEHVSARVLRYMHKPAAAVFEEFAREYEEINRRLDKKQYMIPYFISSHPGSTLDDAIELALYLKERGFVPDQVQDFYPTPGTLSTCMYYTGMDPYTGEKIFVARTIEEKKMQRALLHFNRPENRSTVMKALAEAGREDLVTVLIPDHGGRNRHGERPGHGDARRKRKKKGSSR